jgi:hypothetical protein
VHENLNISWYDLCLHTLKKNGKISGGGVTHPFIHMEKFQLQNLKKNLKRKKNSDIFIPTYQYEYENHTNVTQQHERMQEELICKSSICMQIKENATILS